MYRLQRLDTVCVCVCVFAKWIIVHSQNIISMTKDLVDVNFDP